MTVSRIGSGLNPCTLNHPGLPLKYFYPAQDPIRSFLTAGSPKVLHDFKTHTAVQLAPSVITLVTDAEATAGFLRSHAPTDLDLDRPQ